MKENKFPSNQPVRQPVRWLAWLLLSVLSVFFAEVLSGRSPLVFFNIYGLLVTVPLYGLHLLVLGPLVFQRGVKTSFSTLLLAGAIFGLYEAYITKTLWSPPMDAAAWQIGGVAVWETLVLVLFWHPFMAFIVPLLVGSQLFGSRDTTALHLPGKWAARFRPWWLAVPGAVCGILHGAITAEIGVTLFSSIFSTLLILMLAAFWQQSSRGKRFSLPALLPDRREWRVLALLLLALYLVLGLVIRQEVLPDLPGQLSIWTLYGFFGGLLWLSHRADKAAAPAVRSEEKTPLPFQKWLWFSLSLIVFSAISSLLPEWAGDALYFSLRIAAIPAGIYSLGRSIRYIIKSGIKRHEKQSAGSHSVHPS